MLIKNKFVSAVFPLDDSKIKLRNNNYLKARNFADSGDISILKVNASDVIEFASFPEKSGTPSSANQLVNKSYVDAVLQGLKPKAAVRAATLVAGTLASSFEDGDIIDGVTLATGDRILIKDQAAPAANGIYTVNASGAPTRATDFDSLSPIDEINGAYTFVQEGTQAGQGWVQSGVVTVIDTDAVNFVFFNAVGSIIGGDMITYAGSTIAVDLAASSGLESSNPGNVAGQLRIKVNAATQKINGSNELEGLKPKKADFTLIAGDITNQYIDLADVIKADSLDLMVDGVMQDEGTDYTVSLTGGAGGNTRITFAGDLATAGAAALVAGDIVHAKYMYL